MKDMLAIKKAVSTLRDEEVKSYLTQILAGIGELKEQNGLLENPLEERMAESVAGLIEQYSSLMSLPAQRAFWDPAPDSTHVHILCGDSFGGSMKQALKGLGWTDTHKLIILRENYAIGPLDQLNTTAGRKLRSEWFRQRIQEYFTVSDECEREYNELLDNLEHIPEQAKIVIWTGSNASEQAGLRLTIHLLGNRENELIVMDAGAICEELFNRPDAFINYCHSGEIPADKLREALLRIDRGRRLTAADIAWLTREWQQISEQSGALRIWQEDALLEVPADYYDGYLLEKLDSLTPPPGEDGFLKSARLVGEAIGHCEQYVGDAYFEHRVRELIYSGVLEIKGIPTAMRFYSIRRRKG